MVVFCLVVREEGRTCKQDAIVRYTRQKQRQGIQSRCTTWVNHDDDTVFIHSTLELK